MAPLLAVLPPPAPRPWFGRWAALLLVDLGLAWSGVLPLGEALVRTLQVLWVLTRASRAWFPRDSFLPRVVTVLVGFFAATNLTLRGLEAVGGLQVVPLVLLVAGLCFLGHRSLDRVATRGRTRPRTWQVAMVALAALLTLQRAPAPAHHPLTNWDGLVYHFDWPAQWRARGDLSVEVNGSASSLLWFFPRGAALHSLWFVIGSPDLDPLMAWTEGPALAGCGVAVAALAEVAGASPAACLVAGASFLAMPLVGELFPSGGSDLLLAFHVLAAVLFAARWRRGARAPTSARRSPAGDVPEGLRCGLALGAALATKLVGLILLPVMLVALWPLPGSRRAREAAALGLLALAAPDYGRNLLATGNPVYPSAVSVAGVQVLPGHHPTHGMRLESEDLTPDLEWLLGRSGLPGCLALLGLLAVRRREPADPASLSWLAWALVLYAAPFRYSRWALVPLGLGLAGAARLPELAAGASGGRRQVLGAATAALVLGLVVAGQAGLEQARDQLVDRLGDRPSYRPMLNAWRAVDGVVPEDARLTVVNDPQRFLYRGRNGRRSLVDPALDGGRARVGSLEAPGLSTRLWQTVWLDAAADAPGYRDAVLAGRPDWVLVCRGDAEDLQAEARWRALRALPGFRRLVQGPGFQLWMREGAASKGGRRRPVTASRARARSQAAAAAPSGPRARRPVQAAVRPTPSFDVPATGSADAWISLARTEAF